MKLNVKRNVLSYGIYKICLTVVMETEPRFQGVQCGYVKIIPSPLTPIIKGGDQLNVPYEDPYLIDATLSEDADNPHNLSNIEFYYLCCTLLDPEFNLTYEEIKSLPVKNPDFTANPDTTDPSLGGCYGNGMGRLFSSTTDTKVKLRTDFMKSGISVEIILVMYSGQPSDESRLSTTKQILFIMEGKPPLLQLVSSRNAGRYVSYDKEQVFIGDCQANCEGELTFQWKLNQCTSENSTCDHETPPTQLESMLKTKVSNNSLYYHTKSSVYAMDQWYLIVFRAYRDQRTFGEVSFRFLVNFNPSGGSCTASPSSGTVLEDKFQMICSGWQDLHQPLTYRFYTQKDGLMNIFCTESQFSECKTLLPIGDVEGEYRLPVYVMISDNIGGSTVYKFNVTVNLGPEIQTQLTTVGSLFTTTTSNQSSESESLLNSGDYESLVNLAGASTSILNSQITMDTHDNLNGTGANVTKEELEQQLQEKMLRIELRDSIFNQVASIPVTDIESINIVTGSISSLFEDPFEISQATQQKAVSLMETMISTVDTLQDIDQASGAMSNILSISSKMIQSSGAISSVIDPNNTKTEALRTGGVNETESKHLINQVESQLQSVLDILTNFAVPGSQTVVIETKDAILAATKLPQSTDDVASVHVGGVGTKFNQSIVEKNNTYSSEFERAQNSLTVQLRKTENPFTYDSTASKVKSSITGINFASSNGDLMKVNGTQDPIEITIANKAPEIHPEEVTMGIQPDGTQQNFHRITLQNESFRAIIKPVDENVIIRVYLREFKRPSPEKYSFSWVLPDNSSCRWVNDTEHWNEAIDLLKVNISEDVTCSRDVYSVFVSDEHNLSDVYLGVFYTPSNETSQESHENLNSRKRRSSTNQNTPGPIDIDKVDEEFCVVIKPPPPTPAPTLPPGEWVEQPPLITNASLNYSIEITKAKCLFWDPVNETWGSNGCVVGIETTPSTTQCLCNHLTNFGGDVMVAPNPIDMDQVFAGLKNLGDNLGVLMVIITLWLLYVILLVWAKRKDRKDMVDEQMIVVDCTKSEPIEQTVLLNIVTGAGFGCGTTANVFCILSGEKGKTQIIPLRYEGRKMFQSRSTVAIKVHLPTNIGNLTSIRVFHDNSGTSPSWFLRSILAIDLQNHQNYNFVCDKWLAVESKDGQIERNLTLADEKDLKQFHLVFASTVSKSLVDGHIWFSVFMRPKHSPFTRVRRLSACLALIFLVMLTNAMFFGAGDNPGSRKVVWLGNFKINFTGIIVGIQSAFIIVPPSIIIVEIFRRLGPKKEKNQNKVNLKDKNHDKTKTDNDHTDTKSLVQKDQNLTQPNPDPKSTEPIKKKPFMLPNQCQYIAYFLVFACVGSSSLVCFFYSMMWGPRKSNEWLASMFTGFFQSVLVIQPIKAVVLAVLMAAILKKPVKQDVTNEKNLDIKTNMKTKKKKEYEEGEESNDEEEDECLSGDDGIITADEVPIIRPSDSELEKSRKQKIREKMTGIVIKDIATYLIFLLIVAKLAYMEKDFHTYIYRQDMVNMLKEATYTFGPKFESISNHGYFYSWMRDTLIPGVFAGPWYNDDLVKHQGFIDNHESFLVSIPRIRQVRVQENSCPLPSIFDGVINHCEATYKGSLEDQVDYGIAWVDLNMTITAPSASRRRRSPWIVRNIKQITTTENIRKRKRRQTTTEETGGMQYQKMDTGKSGSLRRRKKLKNQQNGAPIYYVSPEALLPDGSVVSCFDRWEHFSASELRGFPVVGRTNTYPGSGYVANLGYNEETSWTVLADLHIHNWLDKQTRAIFAEFTVYNGNVNLFMTAFLYLETLPTGGAFPWSDFKVFNGYRYSAKDGLQSMWAEMIFICFIIYFGVIEIRKMLKLKFNYFKSFFNLIEATLMPLYLVMFALILIRWLTTSANIKTFKQNPKDFVSFQYAAAADEALMSVIGIVCFLLNLKFLRLLQFAKLFFVIGQVIKSFTVPLLYFMVPFTMYFLLFCWSAHLAFGNQLEEFQTIPRTITTQFLHLLGATDFESITDARPVVGSLYFLAYSGFMLFVAFNMFMAIICEAIDDDFDEEFEKQAGDIQVAEYFTNKLKLLLGRNIDDEIRIDGDDVNEKADSQKLIEIEEILMTFEKSLSRLDSFVDAIHEDFESEKQCTEMCDMLVETSLSSSGGTEETQDQNISTHFNEAETLDDVFDESFASLDTVSEIIEL
eukprot:TCONS_00021135-protein